MVTCKTRILEGTVVGPRPVGGSRFLKGHFCVWEKIAGQDQPVSWAFPTAHHNILAFLREKDDLQTEQRVAGEFLCQQFSLREQIPPATRVCFGSSISPPEKARIFSYNVCTATFLCYLLGLLGQATDTKPQEIQVQQRSGICFSEKNVGSYIQKLVKTMFH